MISIGTVGGALLCFGAVCTLRGRIFEAVFTYILADVCWIVLAIMHGDVQGIVFISIGTALGIAAFIKMRSGVMEKALDHKDSK